MQTPLQRINKMKMTSTIAIGWLAPPKDWFTEPKKKYYYPGEVFNAYPMGSYYEWRRTHRRIHWDINTSAQESVTDWAKVRRYMRMYRKCQPVPPVVIDDSRGCLQILCGTHRTAALEILGLLGWTPAPQQKTAIVLGEMPKYISNYVYALLWEAGWESSYAHRQHKLRAALAEITANYKVYISTIEALKKQPEWRGGVSSPLPIQPTQCYRIESRHTQHRLVKKLQNHKNVKKQSAEIYVYTYSVRDTDNFWKKRLLQEVVPKSKYVGGIPSIHRWWQVGDVFKRLVSLAHSPIDDIDTSPDAYSIERQLGWRYCVATRD